MPELKTVPQNAREWARWTAVATSGDLKVVTVIVTAYTTGLPRVILVDDDTAGGVVTINLRTALGIPGVIYHIKKLGSTGNVVLDGFGSQTIDGSATKTLTSQYERVRICSDGANWHVI